jgi:hypothetical protein
MIVDPPKRNETRFKKFLRWFCDALAVIRMPCTVQRDPIGGSAKLVFLTMNTDPSLVAEGLFCDC